MAYLYHKKGRSFHWERKEEKQTNVGKHWHTHKKTQETFKAETEKHTITLTSNITYIEKLCTGKVEKNGKLLNEYYNAI